MTLVLFFGIVIWVELLFTHDIEVKFTVLWKKHIFKSGLVNTLSPTLFPKIAKYSMKKLEIPELRCSQQVDFYEKLSSEQDVHLY